MRQVTKVYYAVDGSSQSMLRAMDFGRCAASLGMKVVVGPNDGDTALSAAGSSDAVVVDGDGLASTFAAATSAKVVSLSPSHMFRCYKKPNSVGFIKGFCWNRMSDIAEDRALHSDLCVIPSLVPKSMLRRRGIRSIRTAPFTGDLICGKLGSRRVYDDGVFHVEGARNCVMKMLPALVRSGVPAKVYADGVGWGGKVGRVSVMPLNDPSRLESLSRSSVVLHGGGIDVTDLCLILEKRQLFIKDWLGNVEGMVSSIVGSVQDNCFSCKLKRINAGYLKSVAKAKKVCRSETSSGAFRAAEVVLELAGG